MRVTMLFTFLSVLVLGGAGVWAGGQSAKGKFEITEKEKTLLQLINKERAKEKLAPLKPHPILFKVARGHSVNMARQKKPVHNLDGKTPFDRIKAARYTYYKAGENVGLAMNASLEELVEKWMQSPGHRKNIMSRDFTETGLGMAPDDEGVYYFTQVFARPRK